MASRSIKTKLKKIEAYVIKEVGQHLGLEQGLIRVSSIVVDPDFSVECFTFLGRKETDSSLANLKLEFAMWLVSLPDEELKTLSRYEEVFNSFVQKKKEGVINCEFKISLS